MVKRLERLVEDIRLLKAGILFDEELDNIDDRAKVSAYYWLIMSALDQAWATGQLAVIEAKEEESKARAYEKLVNAYPYKED